MDELENLTQGIRRHGQRMTAQRAAILQALCELSGHASAERIHERVNRHQHIADLSTVYRTLEWLRDLRLLSQTDLGRGCAEYEIVTVQPHHHLVCQRCGQVIDLDHSYLAPISDEIRQRFGFEPILDHFAIFGRCQDCLDSSRADHQEPEPGMQSGEYPGPSPVSSHGAADKN